MADLEITLDNGTVLSIDIISPVFFEVVSNLVNRMTPEKPEPEVNWGRDGF